jgi:hypothetical protein
MAGAGVRHCLTSEVGRRPSPSFDQRFVETLFAVAYTEYTAPPMSSHINRLTVKHNPSPPSTVSQLNTHRYKLIVLLSF